METSRRKLLSFVALGGAAIAAAPLAACSSTSKTVSATTLSNDVQLIENGVNYFLTAFEDAGVLSASQLTSVTNVETSIKSVVTALATAGDSVTISTAQGYVTTVETDVKTVLDIEIALANAKVAIPAKVTEVCEAMEALLPVLASFADVVIAATVTPRRVSLTAQQARAILASA